MDMQNYTTPFANTGDTEEFSIDTDPSGKVSLEKGWTELYQLRPEEGGLFILRKVFNQMMKLVSTDTVTWKTQTFPNWIDDKGDGLPFAYPKNAIVKATDGEIYVSLIDDNEDNPIGSVNWNKFDFGDVVDKTTNQDIDSIKTFLESPIVPTPTAGTQAVNKKYVDDNALGVGQTWQDVTTSRAKNTAYTNTTGRTIYISVVVLDNGAGAAVLFVDNVKVGQDDIGSTSTSTTGTISSVIPSGSTYKIEGGGNQAVVSWAELR